VGARVFGWCCVRLHVGASALLLWLVFCGMGLCVLLSVGGVAFGGKGSWWVGSMC